MKISIATIVRGRRLHLLNQAIGIAAQVQPADEWIIISMNEDPLPPPSAGSTRVRLSSVTDAQTDLPLAAARNTAANLADGDLLIFLDVDCIPAADLVASYAAAFRCDDRLWMGSVRYLPEGACRPGWNLQSLAAQGKRNPLQPAVDSPMMSERYELFWSLNFAVSHPTFQRCGGFDAQYRGYGGEDTDFAFAARAADVGFGIAPATAYHQYHESHDPPLRHVASIVSNAKRFHSKWGMWPMEKWLRDFCDRGLVDFDPQREYLELARR